MIILIMKIMIMRIIRSSNSNNGQSKIKGFTIYSLFFTVFCYADNNKKKISKDNLMLIMTVLTCHMSLERIRNE